MPQAINECQVSIGAEKVGDFAISPRGTLGVSSDGHTFYMKADYGRMVCLSSGAIMYASELAVKVLPANSTVSIKTLRVL